MERSISIRGARTHNLRDISLDIPHGRLTVVTGVSGSGKSSLVFDTLYAEGQRRYVQSLSTYARLFLERMDRPDVDSISDIPPALALRQKNTIKNARSSVGTVTEINDYLRLLFATVGKTICPRCNLEVTKDTVEGAAAAILARPGLYVFLAPFEAGSRSVSEMAVYLIQNGYHRVHHDGEMLETADFAARGQFNGNGSAKAIEVVIDRVAVAASGTEERVREALEKAFYLGGGQARALMVERNEGAMRTSAAMEFDRRFNCSRCATAFAEPAPALFSSNSPIGACPECEGFGRTVELDLEKVMPNPLLSLRQGLVTPWRTPAYREMHEWMLKCARRGRIRTAVAFRDMTEEERTWLLDGEPRREGQSWDERWPGIRGFFRWLERRRYKTHVRILLARYRRFVPCPVCNGTKLKPGSLNVTIDGKSIAEVGQIAVRDLPAWLDSLGGRRGFTQRAAVLLRELRNRIGYLNEVGLGYLTLERQARTLSGGEAQRIHLASALGSLLSGTLYALDEPTVGLHAGDSRRLLAVLRHLRDIGNTVVVVEHDPTMIAGGDTVVELGPGGGREGGNLVAHGSQNLNGSHRNGDKPGRVMLMRALSRQRRYTKKDPAVRIVGARENNLRKLDVTIPLGRLVCVTGVSGSGKSTLIESVLYNNYLRHSGEAVSEVGACDRIEGLAQLGEMVHMGQEMPTRSLRSNPATYLKVYDEIRKLFAASVEARRLKIKPRDFSFNVEGGRCVKCHGTGTVTIEMHFMADLEVKCDACDGRRFQSHILAIRWQGRNICEVLDLTIDEARAFFERHPAITRRLEPLAAVGLGYLQLGQPTSTLSGGEAQRLKLARFLLADLEPPQTGDDGKPLPRMFLLDEPTTGLASSDIRRLLRVLSRLVAEGNTMVVIEHNLEFIADADYIIDLGPGGGDEGGRVVVAGDPLRIAASERSLTGRELRTLFGLPASARGAVVRTALREAIGTP
ncbi:MAG TPA: excinuclease ABC subunit UvrA [Candidatus Binataceae bacterium]|nr:excinuclease ABC subunit UvrA [Candidatus Binataceae bacterium]